LEDLDKAHVLESNNAFTLMVCENVKWMLKDYQGALKDVATSLWPSVRMKLTLPKLGDLESSGTPECLDFDSRGQNTSDWGVLDVIEKFLKCRCPKWPRIGHLDICSPSYGKKKGRESNWQFDSRPQKVRNRLLPDVSRWSVMGRWKALEESYNFGSDLTPIEGWSQEL